jgi:AcrR family transcriptional regulator
MSQTIVSNSCFVMAAPREIPDTRSRLLAAAAELFAERGYHGTTVREIALRAGANVAAANYHFGSKEALYLGVLRTQFASIHQLLERRRIAPDERELARLRRRDLIALLHSRVQTMLEVLIGPPPGLHGTLMIREMMDPSEALPVIVAEFIRPQIDEVGAILRRLVPELPEAEIERSVFSIIGQIMFYRLTRPVQLLLRERSELPRGLARELARHITDFSVGGMKSVAARPRGGRHAR